MLSCTLEPKPGKFVGAGLGVAVAVDLPPRHAQQRAVGQQLLLLLPGIPHTNLAECQPAVAIIYLGGSCAVVCMVRVVTDSIQSVLNRHLGLSLVLLR
jgi:hypothetical protein